MSITTCFEATSNQHKLEVITMKMFALVKPNKTVSNLDIQSLKAGYSIGDLFSVPKINLWK